MKTHHFFIVLLLIMSVIPIKIVMADGDIGTKFTNQDSIGNTRHNLTQKQLSGGGPTGAIMTTFRNDYGEICVYCHTPHGANTNVSAPLWNRNIPATAYTTYDQLGTTSINQAYNQPGAASLSCLSCHDGQQAVDAIINMPGSGKYSTSNAFLNSWVNTSGQQTFVHIGLNENPAVGCLSCHTSGNLITGAGAVDFTVFAIGTDLTNDHPIGVTYPTTTGGGTDWNTPGGTKGTTKYFDDGNAKLDKNDIRLYDSGNGPAVECATCHDPHGVPSGGAGSAFNKTFLRKTNTGSAVCLTCHVK